MKSMRDLRRILRHFDRNPGAIPEEDQFVGGVLVPFMRVSSEYHIVFEKRSPHIRQGGEISFPGGEYDPEHDQTTRDTAIRETMEELGVSRSCVHAYRRIGTIVTGRGASVDVYPGTLKIASLEQLSPARSEVDQVFSVPFSFFLETEPKKFTARAEVHSFSVDENGNEIVTFPARELGLPERYHRSWGERPHALYVYTWDGHQIWGMTARVVAALVRAHRQR